LFITFFAKIKQKQGERATIKNENIANCQPSAGTFQFNFQGFEPFHHNTKFSIAVVTVDKGTGR
jgi:hypothetical protein